MTSELTAYRAFFRKLFDHFWGDQAMEMDGADFQDWGVSTGLILKTAYDPAKHGDRGAVEFGIEPGDEWYAPAFPLPKKRTGGTHG